MQPSNSNRASRNRKAQARNQIKLALMAAGLVLSILAGAPVHAARSRANVDVVEEVWRHAGAPPATRANILSPEWAGKLEKDDLQGARAVEASGNYTTSAAFISDLFNESDPHFRTERLNRVYELTKSVMSQGRWRTLEFLVRGERSGEVSDLSPFGLRIAMDAADSCEVSRMAGALWMIRSANRSIGSNHQAVIRKNLFPGLQSSDPEMRHRCESAFLLLRTSVDDWTGEVLDEAGVENSEELTAILLEQDEARALAAAPQSREPSARQSSPRPSGRSRVAPARASNQRSSNRRVTSSPRTAIRGGARTSSPRPASRR